jgi:hypothetical protein
VRFWAGRNCNIKLVIDLATAQNIYIPYGSIWSVWNKRMEHMDRSPALYSKWICNSLCILQLRCILMQRNCIMHSIISLDYLWQQGCCQGQSLAQSPYKNLSDAKPITLCNLLCNALQKLSNVFSKNDLERGRQQSLSRGPGHLIGSSRKSAPHYAQYSDGKPDSPTPYQMNH